MKTTAEERCFVYEWLKSLLSCELKEKQLEQYQQGEFDPLFDWLCELGFDEHIMKIRHEFSQLKTLPFSHLELAADFAQLFLLSAKTSALPYASAYLPEKQLESHLVFLDNLSAEFHLQLNQAMHEPGDHLAVYIELMVLLEKSGQFQRSSDFIQQFFLPWLLPFHRKVRTISTQTCLYQHLLDFFVTFLKRNIS